MQHGPLHHPPTASPKRAAREVARQAELRAADLDDDGCFPEDDVTALGRSGLLLAPFPRWAGGSSLATGSDAAHLLPAVLRCIGAASLPLGRLYEGHVNAIALLTRYGTHLQTLSLAADVKGGMLLGVWNTDDAARPLRLNGKGECRMLEGRKVLCSGVGSITRPLVTARDENDALLMIVPRLKAHEGHDLSAWTPMGMRASATGSQDFTGVRVHDDEIMGRNDDYHRQPAFSGGAWRFAAVHLGGMDALMDLCRSHLRKTGRGGDAHQSARLGQAAIAVETAALWVERTASVTETASREPEEIVAYVNLARLAVERAALDLIELVQRSIGLPAFMRPSPVERIMRDLSTYLRQPAPDRALTTAAAWVLKQNRPMADLWR